MSTGHQVAGGRMEMLAKIVFTENIDDYSNATLNTLPN
jgi:hypothetical protein